LRGEKMKRLGIFSFVLLCTCALLVYVFMAKYHVKDTMLISLEEVTTADYPEDPSHRSIHYDRYGGRQLTLHHVAGSRFDFIFMSEDPKVATVTFKDIDLNLFIPTQPTWTRKDRDLEIIALTDREWNRQQVSFGASSSHLLIEGGDGVETKGMYSADLARNCLNAGLWEVLFFTKEDGKKSLYYQGWFTFPMGFYKEIFEKRNEISYWKHWHRLEHWFNPQGTPVNLAKLRKPIAEKEMSSQHNPKEVLILSGEQLRKARTFNAKAVRCWSDFCREKNIEFASFIPPGRYSVSHPWKNEFHRISKLEKVYLRKVEAANGEIKDELELVFKSEKSGEHNHFIVSGIDLATLPQLAMEDYPKGLYMPMGIAVPPFYQSYEALKKNPPYNTSYFSVLLDHKGRWLNHHDIAIDGPVLHRDSEDPNKIHLYLLSYERHSLVGHYEIQIN
jgi:uncharacterized protein YneR